MLDAIRSLGNLVVPLALGAPPLALATWFLARRIVRRSQSPIRGSADAARTLSPNHSGERSSVLPSDKELHRLEQELEAALRRLERAIERTPASPARWHDEVETPFAAAPGDTDDTRSGGRDADKVRHGFVLALDTSR